ALGNAQTQVVDQYTVAIALGDVVQLDDLVTQSRTGGNIDLVGFAALLELLGLHLFEALQTGLGLGLTPLHTRANPLQLDLHGLGMGGFLLGLLLQTSGLGYQPMGVLALEGDAMTEVQPENPAGDIVEEVTVVGDG